LILRAIMGLPDILMRIFESMYSSTSCAMRCGAHVGEAFVTRVGVQQGCISGSWGFNIFIHHCVSPILDQLAELGVSVVYRLRDGRQLRATDVRAMDVLQLRIGVLFIVDDTTLLADSTDALCAGLQLLYRQFRRYGLVINIGKSLAVRSLCGIRCAAMHSM